MLCTLYMMLAVGSLTLCCVVMWFVILLVTWYGVNERFHFLISGHITQTEQLKYSRRNASAIHCHQTWNFRNCTASNCTVLSRFHFHDFFMDKFCVKSTRIFDDKIMFYSVLRDANGSLPNNPTHRLQIVITSETAMSWQRVSSLVSSHTQDDDKLFFSLPVLAKSFRRRQKILQQNREVNKIMQFIRRRKVLDGVWCWHLQAPAETQKQKFWWITLDGKRSGLAELNNQQRVVGNHKIDWLPNSPIIIYQSKNISMYCECVSFALLIDDEAYFECETRETFRLSSSCCHSQWWTGCAVDSKSITELIGKRFPKWKKNESNDIIRTMCMRHDVRLVDDAAIHQGRTRNIFVSKILYDLTEVLLIRHIWINRYLVLRIVMCSSSSSNEETIFTHFSLEVWNHWEHNCIWIASPEDKCYK